MANQSLGIGTENTPEPTVGKAANTKSLERNALDNKSKSATVQDMGEPAQNDPVLRKIDSLEGDNS